MIVSQRQSALVRLLWPLIVTAAAFSAWGCVAPSAVAVTLINGIDVSNFQGTINWTSVKNAGIQFAFAKATEGVDFVDAKYTTNIVNAPAAGVYIGPYHFARPSSNFADPMDPINEANDFVDAIQPYYQTPGKYLRPVVDFEDDHLDRINLSQVPETTMKAYLSRWLRSFIGQVQTRLGMTPLVYTYTSYAQSYIETNINQYPLWIANYNYAPPTLPPASTYTPWPDWSFWQYSSSGTVSGISGAVDKDVYKGTVDQLLTQYLAVPPNGDFNKDGAVDSADFLIWQQGFGSTGAAATFDKGDANGDKKIDDADLAVWTADFNAANPTIGAVPEPATAGLLVVGALAVLRTARRGPGRRVLHTSSV